MIRLPTPDPRHLPAGTSAECATAYFLAKLEEVLVDQHDQIAAMVLEPLIQAAAGMVFHPSGYLRGVRELTERYKVLLIADEIVTGFGRTGLMFACQHEDVVPDILCLGKSITGGTLPLAASIASPEIYSAFLGPNTSGRSFHHGHTYGGNPLASAAALANLDVMEQDQVLSAICPKAEILEKVLAKLQSHAHVAETRQHKMIAAVELADDEGKPYPSELRIGAQICREALRQGVWLRPLRDVLVIMPPLSISANELNILGDVLLESIDIVTREITECHAESSSHE